VHSCRRGTQRTIVARTIVLKKRGKFFKKLLDELDLNIQLYATETYSKSVHLSATRCTSPTVQSDLSRRKRKRSRDVSEFRNVPENPVTQSCSTSDVIKNNARLNKLFWAVFLYKNSTRPTLKEYQEYTRGTSMALQCLSLLQATTTGTKSYNSILLLEYKHLCSAILLLQPIAGAKVPTG
jgi:hypothetical protein